MCISKEGRVVSHNVEDPAVARGQAARRLVAEDARWAADLLMSASTVEAPHPALLLGHHMVRIAYEGTVALRSKNPLVGLPPLADLIGGQFAAITARTRHLTKLLDDSSKGYDDVVAGLELERLTHQRHMAGPVGRLLGLRVADLGLYTVAGEVVGASVPIGYRQALDPRGTIGGQAIAAVTHEWGGTLMALTAADLTTVDLTPTLALDSVRVQARDVVTSRYLGTRYDDSFREGVKLLMLMIEGDLNTLRVYLPQATGTHDMAAFRARVITVFHVLTALREIDVRHSSVDSRPMRQLRRALRTGPATRLLSRSGEHVRHRCMHYEVRDPRITPSFERPMFGLVEAVFPGSDVESFNADVSEVVESVSTILNGWSR